MAGPSSPIRAPGISRSAGGLAGLALFLGGAWLVGCGVDRQPAEQVEPGRPAAERPGARAPAYPEPGAASGRSLLLITLDTTRADRLGCYGYEGAETPSLDRQAADGLRFADAVSPVPITLPAHATLFTGLDPPGHGVRVNGEYTLDPERPLLAEILAAAGYDTAAFVSAFVLDPRFGLDRGFVHYDAELEPAWGADFGQQVERSAERVTDAALAWLAGRLGSGRDEPFFLWVHYFDPHDPYDPPEPYASRFRGRPYDGEIAYMDAHLGRLLRALETAGLADQTVTVVTADHGESLGEHEERYHSRTIYEGAVRVPLLLSAPGLIEGGQVIDGEVVGLVDLMPTLLELLGLQTPEGLDGESLLGGGPPAGRALYLETLNTYVDNGWAPLYGLRRHEDKYIEAPRPEYYDLLADPGERRNLLVEGDVAAAAELAESLRGRLAGQPGVAEVAARQEAADPEVRRRLEALGYLTGAGPPPGAEELPDPKDMLPLHDRLLEARAAVAAGDPKRAVRLGRELIRAAPRNRAALQLLGEAYAVMGDLERAERVLRHHLEVGPAPGATVLFAQVVMHQGRFEEAEALLDRAAGLDPHHGAVPLARGDMRLVQGRPAEARQLYEEARRIDPFRMAGLAGARLERLERLAGERE